MKYRSRFKFIIEKIDLFDFGGFDRFQIKKLLICWDNSDVIKLKISSDFSIALLTVTQILGMGGVVRSSGYIPVLLSVGA